MHKGNIDAAFWSGKRVLVTGHTGFKGSWLGLWLSELEAKVTGVALEPETKPNLFNQLKLEKRMVASHIADIRDAKVLADIVKETQPEVVFHLAAQPLVRRSYEDPLNTWSTNVQGSLHLLEALKQVKKHCSVVMVTTDKVYENKEWVYGYREIDRLGGHDPYSASKAATEIAVASWRSSFCGMADHQTPYLAIATARAGNVIGGGDWANNRIVPDAMRSLARGRTIEVRNPLATRPWQHVLEPVSGYIILAQCLAKDKNGRNEYTDAFNFGPNDEANKTVGELIAEIIENWGGGWREVGDEHAPHEAARLQLNIDKAHHQLGWKPRWNFKTTVERTVSWYKDVKQNGSAMSNCLSDIETYEKTTRKSIQ